MYVFSFSFASSLHSVQINAHLVSSYWKPTWVKQWYSDSEHLCWSNSIHFAEKVAKYFIHFWGEKGETSVDYIKKTHENTLLFWTAGFAFFFLYATDDQGISKEKGKNVYLLENH